MSMTRSAKACCSLALFALSSSSALTTTAFVRSSLIHSSFRSASIAPLCRRKMSSSNEAEVVVNVADNLQYVKDKMKKACEESGRSVDDVRLVAVSKTKPLELLQQAYNASQRIFGENYAQELVEKADQMPKDVEWHFIGSLQSNKANMLVKSVVPASSKLTVETVSSLKLANKLNNAMDALDEEDCPKDRKLHVFIQINTSGEESKSGIEPSEAVALCKEISEQCDRLELQGLMTIGAPGDLGCFDSLVECRDKVCSELGIERLEVSMGMSGDFEAAIERGATNVRVGSTIFGARNYSNTK